MQTQRLLIALFLSMLGAVGCAALFVPETSDPRSKLNWATELFDRQNRPIPAERLIREAIEIYQKENDQLGLAEAYRTYGFFFRSPSVEKLQKYYRDGFLDKTASFDTRYAKSIEFFIKAKEIFVANRQHGELTNVYFNMAQTYRLMNNREAACAALDQSLESNREFVKANPHTAVETMAGFASYGELVAAQKNGAGC